MTLKEWMDEDKDRTQDNVATALGCDQAHVSRLYNAKAIGSPATIAKIEELTHGAVTLADMVRAHEAASEERGA